MYVLKSSENYELSHRKDHTLRNRSTTHDVGYEICIFPSIPLFLCLVTR